MTASSHTHSSTHHTARLPVAIDRKQVRIRPTRNGVIFIVLVLAMFAGSLNYSSNLGFLFTFFLGSIAFVSMASTYKNICGISIGSIFAEPVFAGETATFELMVAGGVADSVAIGFGFENHPTVYHDLAAHENNHIWVPARAGARGIYKPGPLSIHSDFPLGLFRLAAQIDPDLACIVYPKPVPGELRTTDVKFPAGEDRRLSGPGADEFQGLKSYVPGDPLQRISWRASARGQGLFSKNFKGTSGSAVLLDWHGLKSADPERKLSLLCHMVLKAGRDDIHYGLRLPGYSLEPGKGRDHQLRCLKALALF